MKKIEKIEEETYPLLIEGRGKYRSTTVKKILEEVSLAEPITKVVKNNGITWNTWNAWCKKDPTLDEQFQKAKERSIYYSIDSVETLSREAIEKARTGEYNMTTIKALDIYIRHKQFMAQKLASKIFGSEKEKLTLTSSQGQKLEIEWLK